MAEKRPTVRSEALFDEARQRIPGGVNSPVRAFGSVGGTPRFMARGQGARVWDVDGNEYVDFVGSWGPLLLGHAHPAVVQAVQKAAESGTTFGAPTEAEVELARMVQKAFPSMELLRLVSSGTEACMSAVRAARAFTGRDKVIKFAGCYHGHADGMLVQAGSGAATLSIPDSKGVPQGYAAETLVAEYNNIASVGMLFDAHPDKVAAIIVEPVVGNMGVVQPRPGFLQSLRELTTRHGALLIFDEVITGFRVSLGGAQQHFRVKPDLTCLGKIIGGGLPVGAYGGRRDIMSMIAPLGPAYQAGTLSGNPLATAAGIAMLKTLRATPDAYTRLNALGLRLEEGLREALRQNGGKATVQRVGSMLTLFFNPNQVISWRTASKSDTVRYARFFHAMLDRGIYLPPSQYEAWFISLAHTEPDIDRAIAAAHEALRA